MICERCDRCQVYMGHAASCPTQLQTKEQRAAFAAHLFQVFTGFHDEHLVIKSCQLAGLSTADVEDGRRLAKQQQAAREEMTAWLGDPSYGGWGR